MNSNNDFEPRPMPEDSESRQEQEFAELGPDEQIDAEQNDSEQDGGHDDSGFHIHWFGVLLLVGLLVTMDDYSKLEVYSYMAAAVLLHEFGHTLAGVLCKCRIKSVQVFFMPVISYKAPASSDGTESRWSRIRWCVGTLPFGGVTVFENGRGTAAENRISNLPLWQQLVISSAGVGINIATFLILEGIALCCDCPLVCIIMARVSLLMGLLNLIPIYPLDGGSMMLLLFQMVTGIKPSQKFMNTFALVGVAAVILLFFVFDGIIDRLIQFLFIYIL